MMKMLLVGDNRNRANWGCRGTSIALSLLLSKRDVVDAVNGVEVAAYSCTPTYTGAIMPSKLYKFFHLRRGRGLPRACAKLADLFGARSDYINDSPEESVDNFLRYKNRHHHLQTIFEKVQRADAIVVNGEGDFILTTPPRRNALFYLMIIELARRMGKPCVLVNAIVSDCPKNGRNAATAAAVKETLCHCAGIQLRDPLSLELLHEICGGLSATYMPDALFSFFPYFSSPRQMLPVNGDLIIPYPERDRWFGSLDFSKPYICVGGSSRAAAEPQSDTVAAYSALVERVRGLGLGVMLVQTCDGDAFLDEVSERSNVPIVPLRTPILSCGAIVANASLMISGRYHPSILASLGGTPCIFLGSNSHKTRSLQDVLEYETVAEYGSTPSNRDIDGIMEDARRILDVGDEARRPIRDTAAKCCRDACQVVDFIENSISAS